MNRLGVISGCGVIVLFVAVVVAVAIVISNSMVGNQINQTAELLAEACIDNEYLSSEDACAEASRAIVERHYYTAIECANRKNQVLNCLRESNISYTDY